MIRKCTPKALNNLAQGNSLGRSVDIELFSLKAINNDVISMDRISVALSRLKAFSVPNSQGVALRALPWATVFHAFSVKKLSVLLALRSIA